MIAVLNHWTGKLYDNSWRLFNNIKFILIIIINWLSTFSRNKLILFDFVYYFLSLVAFSA